MPYFVIGIFFCAFYLMNLVLAMVYLSYEQQLSSDGNEVLLDIRKFNQHREAHSKSEPTRVSVVFCFSRRNSSQRNSPLVANKFDNC